MADAEHASGEHALRFKYHFSFIHRQQKDYKDVDYDQAITPIGTCETVEQFWRMYAFHRRPDDLPFVTEYHMFRDGIKPLWEDPGNVNGGKWIIRVRKGLASLFWENLVLAVIGDQFDVEDEICGLVISVRKDEDILAVWTKTAKNRESILRIRDVMKDVLHLPASTTMEYKEHNQSLQDKSSFRNTDVFRLT